MKHNIFLSTILVMCLAASCGTDALTVMVTNDSELARQKETVEVCFKSLQELESTLTAENVVVLDAAGEQIPSQVYRESDGTVKLLFQVDVEAGKQVAYSVEAGQRKEFPMQAYSRHVPERKDDYAYENNLVAGRIYGPALDFPRTFGSDVWVKSTDRLIIDEWFAKGDYHHNYGEGMDCYKVGATLGGGALAPYVEEKIVLGDNWSTCTHITDGPIRTKAVFTYATFDAGEYPVAATREISLDANTRFVRSSTFYTPQMDNMDLVLAAVTHDVISRENGENYIAFTEKASDSKDPERDGDISIGLVLDPAMKVTEVGDMDGHAVIKTTCAPDDVVTVWTASGWSQGGVESPESWNQYVKNFAYAVANPLHLEIQK